MNVRVDARKLARQVIIEEIVTNLSRLKVTKEAAAQQVDFHLARLEFGYDYWLKRPRLRPAEFRKEYEKVRTSALPLARALVG